VVMGQINIRLALTAGVGEMNNETCKVNWPKRVLMTCLGASLLILGLAMVVLPGPAIIFVPAGLALLALEYDFARRWLLAFRRWLSSHSRARRLRHRN
jgi:hypothetical protein